jgi:hypothetical protein
MAGQTAGFGTGDPGADAIGTGRAAHVGVVVPAKDEAARIASTVTALVASPGVTAVVVVDDGSTDDTGARARAAGADVVRHGRNRGKAAALETGAARLAVLEARSRAQADAATAQGPTSRGATPEAATSEAATSEGATPEAAMSEAAMSEAATSEAATSEGAGTSWASSTGWPLLFVDADLGETAANTLVLAEPVLAGEADLAIAVLPPQSRPGGGRGFVVRLARRGIVHATGWTPTQPLSGMRCLTREAFEAARPLAHGWGVETAMTIDLLTAGYRVVEVPCDLQHRVTGADWHAQLHRLRQYRDVARGLAVRRARRAAPLRVLRRLPRRVALRSRP